MCDLDRILKVVEIMNPHDIVSKGTLHAHIKEVTILLNGRSECNPCKHRRDWADLMLIFKLYVYQLPSGLYVSGSHRENEHHEETHIHPGVALTEMAYYLLTK